MAVTPCNGSGVGDRGMGVDVGTGVRVGRRVVVTVSVSVIVEVEVCDIVPVGESVARAVGVDVSAGRRVIVGLKAMIAAAGPGDVPNARVALTDETTCVTIKMKAIRAATIPRDASELL